MKTKLRPAPEWLYWPSSFYKQVILILIISIFYYSTGSIGLLLSIPNTNVSTVWPPSGIALAAGLLYSYRIWPAIFLGSLINNLVEFSDDPTPFYILSIVSLLIALGSVLQMIVGLAGINLLIKEKDILGSAVNVFKFLFVALISCLVNSNIGTFALAIAKVIPWSEYDKYFLNWWLGDTAGVFVFTPLILAWVQYYFPKMSTPKIFEALILIICVFLANILLFHLDTPFLYFLIPLMVWGGLRFSHQGATLMVLITSVMAIYSTLYGSKFFDSINTSLIFIQSFIAITTIMTLSLGAVVQERFLAYDKLKEINLTLEQRIEERTKEIQMAIKQLKAMQEQIVAKEKLASLGELTAGIAHEIKNPLNFINNFAELSIKQANKLIDFFEQNKDLKSSEEMEKTKKILETIISNITKIGQYGQRADSIVRGMLSHARKDSGDFRMIDLNSNIKEIVKQMYQSKQSKNPSFKSEFQYTLDPTITKISVISEEFNRVIMNILDNAFFAVEKNKERLGDQYFPKILIFTKNLDEKRISILIRDNGIGIPSQQLKKIFTPFFTTKPPGEGTGLGLSLSRDVIVSAHQGELRVNTKEGEYTEFLIILPKVH